MKKTKRVLIAILCFALIFVMGGEVILSAFSLTASAAETNSSKTKYTNVLDDLKKDPNFDPSEFPEVENFPFLRVMQIAESNDGELFVYVYQPSDSTQEIIATSVNISQEIDQTNIQNFSLELLSSEGVFDKYLVKDITLRGDVLRYYFISTIYRAYDKDIDGDPLQGNVIDQVSQPVGQKWSATLYNGEPVYAVEYLDLIVIENKHVGSIRYKDLKHFSAWNYTDSHYIAFSTSKPMDRLMSADVSYWYKSWSFSEHSHILHAGLENDTRETAEPIRTYKTLLQEDIFGQNNLFGDDYKYNRIQTTEEFLNGETEKINDQVKSNLSSTEWVLRICEYEYYHIETMCTDPNDNFMSCQNVVEKKTDVGGFTILRLTYEYDQKIYQVACVDNISSGDGVPDNDDWDKNDWDGFEFPDFSDGFDKIGDAINGVLKIIGLVLLAVVVVSLLPLVKPIFDVILSVLLYPLKLLKSLFGKK